eukprot:15620908-Heterocapsa_arctica.AAC.1
MSNKNELGRMLARRDVYEVTDKTAGYRCAACRKRATVHKDNPTFGLRDRLDEAVYSFWMFVQGAPLTLTCLHMGRREDLVRRYYHHAAAVMAKDALLRQSSLVFGRRTPLTTVCEADETRVGKFRVTINGIVFYYHWVLLGVVIRGDPSCLWLLLVGLTRSADRSRVPPLTNAIWKQVCDTIFEGDSNMILMTDGAGIYEQQHPGILEHYAVNHQEKEWTRPVEPIFNVETGERRCCLASTNFLDSTWQRIKSQIPGGLKATTAGGRKTKENYIRAAQWKMMVAGEDRWEAFCVAAHRWRRDYGEELTEADAGQHGLAVVEEGAGQMDVPYGFEQTGGAADLKEEREIRAEL